eukprot:COSAG01_NODE_62390_length_284_cov_40.989189_1_plen_62_part_10
MVAAVNMDKTQATRTEPAEATQAPTDTPGLKTVVVVATMGGEQWASIQASGGSLTPIMQSYT